MVRPGRAAEHIRSANYNTKEGVTSDGESANSGGTAEVEGLCMEQWNLPSGSRNVFVRGSAGTRNNGGDMVQGGKAAF